MRKLRTMAEAKDDFFFEKRKEDGAKFKKSP